MRRLSIISSLLGLALATNALVAYAQADARRQSIESWLSSVNSDGRPVDAKPPVEVKPASDAKAVELGTQQDRLKSVEAWLSTVNKDGTPSVMAAAPPASPLALKIEHNFESIKYVVFFATGSSQLGPKARRTVNLLVPAAKKADQVVVTGRTDSSGSPELNVVLSRKRGEAIAKAMRKQGATKPAYVVASGALETTEELAPEVKAVWMPSAPADKMRRADIDVRTNRDAPAP